jgi:uncharacterized protein (TIGR02996 family)
MQDDFHFLRALFRQPDDGLRLIYADWLEERGDLRAAFLRLEVEWYGLPKDDTNRKAALKKRMEDLQRKLDADWVTRIGCLRNLTRGTRHDLVLLTDGKGLIEVLGDQDDTALLVEGKPVALNWNDCLGSVGQYLVFTGHTCGSDYVRQLRAFGAGEVDEDRPLSEQIEPLLALFASGTYCLSYLAPAVSSDVYTLEYFRRSIAEQELLGYYPFDATLVCTQTHESLNDERVLFYCEQIRAGQRPIVLTVSAETAWCEFVIDGHHKLEAYNRERVKPAILNIMRWKAPRISLEEGLGFLPSGHRGIGEYRRLKGVP